MGAGSSGAAAKALMSLSAYLNQVKAVGYFAARCMVSVKKP